MKRKVRSRKNLQQITVGDAKKLKGGAEGNPSGNRPDPVPAPAPVPVQKPNSTPALILKGSY